MASAYRSGARTCHNSLRTGLGASIADGRECSNGGGRRQTEVVQWLTHPTGTDVRLPDVRGSSLDRNRYYARKYYCLAMS